MQSKREAGCLFCKIHKQKKDSNNYIALRSSTCFVVLNRFPYNNGHLLITPYRHISEPDKLNDEEVLDMHRVTLKMKEAIQKILRPDGFNTGLNLGRAAGAGITEHIHLHLVPRWIGDTNFMPVLSETKIISESLKGLYRKLKRIA